MRFWDASALVPLVCREPESSRCRAWLKSDPVVLVWALAATEITSALARKQREGALSPATITAAKHRLAGLERGWNEITQIDAVRAKARRLLEAHALGAADALHLAAPSSPSTIVPRTSGASRPTAPRGGRPRRLPRASRIAGVS